MPGSDLIIGLTTMIVCLLIQCSGIGYALRVIVQFEKRHLLQPTFLCSTTILSISLLFLLAGNLLQIGIWAAVFKHLGEFSTFRDAYYHSIVNFSTLGYGDIVMSEKHKMLGGLEAVNGVIMFGLTTAFLYSIYSVLIQRVWQDTDFK